MRHLLLLIATFTVLAACSQNEPAATEAEPKTEAPGEVNLYSARHYDTDMALYTEFTEATGIKVNLIEGNGDALLERISTEGELSPADVFITVDAGRLWRAEEQGVFAAVDSGVLTSRVPTHLRHPENLWFGLSKRARVIIYNKEAGKPEGVETYADLADPSLAGKVCIRSSSNIYNISLLASMVERDGAEAAETWARGVVSNFAREPQGNDTAHIRAVASGECQVGLVNTYYLARLLASEENRSIAEAVGVIFPNQESTGTHVNISGAGLIATSPNRDNAIRFLEYLTEEKAQKYLADGNHEYPVVAGVPGSDALQSLGTFTEDTLNATALGRNQAEAVRVFDRAGWK
jgi:iron(III) transport system substrate-binding protein